MKNERFEKNTNLYFKCQKCTPTIIKRTQKNKKHTYYYIVIMVHCGLVVVLSSKASSDTGDSQVGKKTSFKK